MRLEGLQRCTLLAKRRGFAKENLLSTEPKKVASPPPPERSRVPPNPSPAFSPPPTLCSFPSPNLGTSKSSH